MLVTTVLRCSIYSQCERVGIAKRLAQIVERLLEMAQEKTFLQGLLSRFRPQLDVCSRASVRSFRNVVQSGAIDVSQTRAMFVPNRNREDTYALAARIVDQLLFVIVFETF